MSFADAIEKLRAAGDPNALVEGVPYARFLGLHIELADGELIACMRFGEHLIGDSSIPALHGGTIGALLESAAIFTLLWVGDDVIALPKTINLTVDYLRSGRGGKDTRASASITKQGRRIVSVRAVAWQDDRDKPIATADAHFLIAG